MESQKLSRENEESADLEIQSLPVERLNSLTGRAKPEKLLASQPT
jgi:hypothetical protein